MELRPSHSGGKDCETTEMPEKLGGAPQRVHGLVPEDARLTRKTAWLHTRQELLRSRETQPLVAGTSSHVAGKRSHFRGASSHLEGNHTSPRGNVQSPRRRPHLTSRECPVTSPERPLRSRDTTLPHVGEPSSSARRTDHPTSLCFSSGTIGVDFISVRCQPFLCRRRFIARRQPHCTTKSIRRRAENSHPPYI